MSTNISRVAARYIQGATNPGRLDPKLKNAVNKAFVSKGLDGNGRFEKPERGYSKAIETLGDFGLEMDEVVNSFLFRQDANHFTIRIALSNNFDSFSPTSIINSKLVISYTKLAENKFEVLAYLS